MNYRDYWVDLTPTAVAVATTDILELLAADDKPIEVLSVSLFQTTEIGDAMSEVLSFMWVRGNTTTGSGGNTVTPRPCNKSDAAAGFTAESFNTTAASAGTAVQLPRHGMQVLAGLERPYTPEERFNTGGADLLVLRLSEAPDDSVTIGGSVLVREYG